MHLYDNEFYMQDVSTVGQKDLPWDQLAGKKIMLSGATGMIGSFLIDVLIEKGIDCQIYALGRDENRFRNRFREKAAKLTFVSYDAGRPFPKDGLDSIDYIMHLASNTHPLQYSTDPIGTITTNIIGLMNMLEFAETNDQCRFVFASSNEIYGENRGDVELFDEDYCGYINSNTMRAGYPESKRCGEALCQAYKAQAGLNVVIPRFTRTYGPTMLMSDTKAISQFIKKGLAGEEIVLKSAGTQFFSYQYVADSVSGLLTILLCGKNGEAYNIANEKSDIMLKDLAALIAEMSGTKVKFEIPDAVEAAGYSTATKARLDGKKLKNLGWEPIYDIKAGISRTMAILKEIGV